MPLETELLALKAGVQASRIQEDITTLAGFGTRHTLSDTESNERGIGAVSYTHLTLPTICSV